MPSFTISGRITTPAGKPLPGLTVKAFDWNPRGEEKTLGKEDKTRPQGGYTITYTDAELRAGGREQGGVDLIIRVYEVFEADGKNRERKLAESALLRNAEAEVTIDLTVPLRMLRRQGRYQALRNAVKPALRARLADALEDSGESWEALRERLAEEKDFDEATLRQLEFQHRLGEIADDHEPLAEVFRKDAKVKSLRDMALNYDRKRIRDLVRDKAKVGVPEDAEGDDDEQKAEQYADDVAERLFQYAPGAVFQRLARDKAIDLDGDDAAGNLRKGVETFFNNRPNFDMRRTSVLIELEEKDALKDVPEVHREQVKERLKACQRVAALSPHEEIAAKLLRLGLDSAYLINDIPANAFVRQYARHLGGERMAQRIHRQAQDIATRNAHTWAAMRHELQSPGTTFTHGGMDVGARAGVLESVKSNGGARSNRKLLSYETLFGSVDICECDHCNSVYSPAAYLVDLFQYLRNNNLETDNPKRGKGRDGIFKTPLGKLFNIRPDLGELELSCENTNTILPYIDLVNEVLESYVAHLDEARKNNAKKVDIDVHDVEDESTGELLSEPRHINLEAYRILQKAVYPFTLPYDLPIDMAREYLKFLGAGRHELMRVFRTGAQPEVKPGIDAAKAQQIADQENIARGRAVDAEALGMTEEEYLIIAEEAFLSRAYYNLKDGTNLTNVQYLEKVGIRKRFEYYGFTSVPAMQAGLRFIKPAPNELKAGFLQRAGIEYTDLIALLQTNACNPNQLPDRAQDFFNRIRFHYQQLAALVKTGETDYKKKYAPVIKVLSELKTGGRRAQKVFERKDELECWVYRYFERAGKQIVLVSESNTDSCDLSKVQLRYLDGTDLGWPEYIIFQRFIRLWCKLGWSIPELDQALTGLAKKSAGTFLFDPKEPCKPETVGAFTYAPTAEVLHQLAVVKQLLVLTGIELPKLLTFWAPIGTEGENSLYKRLFIKHNLKSIDDVFEPDRFGLVLTEGEKISEHTPVLMAALGLSAGDIDVIRQHANIPDELSIETVSALYRHGLLAKALRMKIGDLPGVLDLITRKGKNMDAHPFKNADGALLFVEQYQRMVDAGFKPETLLYALFDTDDPEQALAPDKRMVLSLAVALRQTLLQIESEHADLPDGYPVTDDLLRSKLGLLFDQGMVENVLGFLKGTLVFGDNTRSAATKKEIKEAKTYYQERLKNNEDEKSAEKGKNTAFLKRVKYDTVNGLQITGILAPEDVAKVRAMFPKAKVPEKALNKILSQPLSFFEDVLQAFIPPELLVGVRNTLLAPDETTSDKAEQFYRHFLPYLREQLRQHQVARLCAAAVKLDEETTRLLLMDVLKNALKEPVYSEIIRLKDQDEKSGGAATAWEGYFVPVQDGHYRFILESVSKAKMSIQGKSQWDKAALTDDEGLLVHRSPRQYFQAGHAYLVTLEGYDADGSGFIPGFKWRFGDQTAEPVPAHVLFPALRTRRFGRGFERLYKAALLINGFGLDAAEVAFFQAQGGSFAQLDFNALDWKHWLHLEAYCRLRRTLPKGELSLLDFLRWAHDPDGPEDNVMTPKETKRELAGQIARLTGWNKPEVLTLLHGERFNLGDPVHFRNGQNLFKLGEAMDLIAQTGVSPQKLFDWARPNADFSQNLRMARGIRKAAQARYQQEEWEAAVKPLSDELRKRRRDALVAFLLVQPELIEAGVHDADSFFQYFLIDAQMDSCMETSRIKQAISSVQLFIQQCLLGLRAKQGIPADLLDEERWEGWMRLYRVWEANRKVFLYPENWIEPDLRDDKSPFFKELESELLQNDISKENVEKALINYLFKMDDVANLEILSLYVEGAISKGKVHIFGRTHSYPHLFYYRYYNTQTKYWAPWIKLDIDIPSYSSNVSNNASDSTSGCYIIPVVWNKRLFVFFPEIILKSRQRKSGKGKKIKEIFEGNTSQDIAPLEYLEIRLGYTEFRNERWIKKRLSTGSINNITKSHSITVVIDNIAKGYNAKYILKEIEKFSFIPCVFEDKIQFSVHYYGEGVLPSVRRCH
ncbi:MAG: hypothetical protein IT260_18985 [Saprospiraceae bacterium]|nr:hypothetical protein [Saprospiraceae bacterium]